jgi:hypothetical protein
LLIWVASSFFHSIVNHIISFLLSYFGN